MPGDQIGTSKIPPRMNAIRLHRDAGPEGLVYEQIATPAPAAGEVLVRVLAAAITRDELTWPVNRLPAIPSYEFSGVVAALGPRVDDISVGAPVYALSAFDRDGAAADYIVVQREFLAAKPKSLDYVHAAAVPLAALSAWQGLFEHGQLAKGERVLIHGASGGVGHFAVQLAHGRGAYVIGTVSTSNLAAAERMGMDQVIDTTSKSFEKVVHDVDLVFDTAGGERLERSPEVLRRGGRLVSVASEPSAEQAAARGITSIYFVVKPNGEQLLELANLVDSGKLQPVVDQVLPLAQARQAFECSLSRHGAGKIVLRIADE